MSGLFRFGVSLPQDLVRRFDSLIKEKNYPTRSKAIGDLIREALIRREWQKGKVVAGAITLIYDHHKRELVNKLMDIQHNYQKLIISTQHVHLDHHNCLEIVAVKGAPKEVVKLTDSLKSVKGVKHTTLSMSSTGRDID